MITKPTALAVASCFLANFLAVARVPASTVPFQEDVSPTAAFQAGATFAREIGPTSNFDVFNFLYIGSDGSGPTGRVRSFFNFDLSVLPDGAAISAITFSLRSGPADFASVSTDVPIELRLLAGPFNESTLTWDNQPVYSTLLSTITANPKLTDSSVTFTWPSSAAFIAAAQAAGDANGTLNFLARVDDAAEAHPEVRKAFFPSDDDTNPPTPSINPLLTVSILPADFDGNRVVEGADLPLWKAGFGTTGNANHMQGDADGDRDVDGADLLVWQRRLGADERAASSMTAASAAVPEPAAAGLLFAATCVLSAASRRIGVVRSGSGAPSTLTTHPLI